MPSNFRGLFRRFRRHPPQGDASGQQLELDPDDQVSPVGGSSGSPTGSLSGHLETTYSDQQGGFDPFDPIHNNPPAEVHVPLILDHDVMIVQLREAVLSVETSNPPVTLKNDGLQDLDHTPWLSFFLFCEACKEVVLSDNSRYIGTLDWFNTANKARVQQYGSDEKLRLCYACWLITRIRMIQDNWTVTDDVIQTDYNIWSNWNSLGFTDGLGRGCVFFFDGNIPFPPQASPESSSDTHTFIDPYSRLVPATGPKFDMINAWLHECQSSHGPECNKSIIDVGMDRDLTLIDVKQRCLVKVPGNTRYVVLSYVWGGPQLMHLEHNHDVLFQPGGLDHPDIARQEEDPPLGQVIKDSMDIAASIGERYLWADALCIKQDDLEDKALEIMRMASIYSCAVVTIVPIENTNAHQPIPGISSSRNTLSESVINTSLSMSLRKQLLPVIRQSYYNTRGWCFQEAGLSRKTLYFSNQQVFFRCQTGVHSEDALEQWTWTASVEEQSPLTSLGIFNDIPRWKLENHCDVQEQRRFLDTEGYGRLVSMYWQRNLAFNNDIEDAFSAIATALEVYLGVPISAGLPENLFHHVLLWTVQTPRWGDDAWVYPGVWRDPMESGGGDLIPSWSWVGWREYCCSHNGGPSDTIVHLTGGINNGQLTLSLGLIPLISDLEIEIRGAIRRVEVLDEVYNNPSFDADQPFPHAKLRLQAVGLPEKPHVPPAHKVLRFWAHALPLRSAGIQFGHRPRIRGRELGDLYGTHTISDSQHRHCGTYHGIAVNDKDCDVYHRLEVIILSAPIWTDTKVTVYKLEDDDARTFDDPYEIGHWKTLCFMLVCWGAETGHPACERLGVGEIHVDALVQADLSPKFIRLR